MSSVRRKPLPSESSQPIPSEGVETLPVPQTTDDKSLSDVSKYEKVEEKDLEAGTLSAPQPPAPSYSTKQESAQEAGTSAFRKPSRESVQLAISARLASSTTIWQKFKRKFPSHRTFFGLKRRTFFIILGIVVALLLALVIGLSVGLSRRHSKQNIPLPQNSKKHDGDLTYYAPGLGACGVTSSASDNIVAISQLVFDAVQKGSNPNANPLCGKKIRASRYNEKDHAQRSVDLTVVDRCVGCKPDDIDVTTSVFDQLAERDLGRTHVSWAWLDVDISQL